MAGQRRTVGPRSRRSWLPALTATGVVVLLAAAGAAAYLVAFRPPAKPQQAALPTQVLGFQTVGLIAEGISVGGQVGQLVQLLGPQGSPAFSQVGQAEVVSGHPQWTADSMAGGTYIFIYLPTGQCLGQAGTTTKTLLALQHCDLTKAQQRWLRRGSPVLQGGHNFYQFASASSGKCITQVGASGGAGLSACDPSRPGSQMLAFWWRA